MVRRFTQVKIAFEWRNMVVLAFRNISIALLSFAILAPPAEWQ